MVLQNLELIYDDLIDNKGLQYKTLMNDMLGAAERGGLVAVREEDSSVALRNSDPSLPTPLDSVETLITRLESAKNRKEKRRLLAEYNQQ